MLVSWEKRAGLHSEDGANESSGVFQGLLADFWEGLGLLFVRYADNEDADPQALEGVATLLQVSLVLANLWFRHTRIQQINMAVGAIHAF